MKNLSALSLKTHQGELYVLDQTLLPHQQQWLHCTTVTQMVTLIQRLQLRGAPAIGIGASLLLAYRATQGDSQAQLQKDAEILRAARPTAVNLMNNLDSMLEAIQQTDFVSATVACAEALFAEDVALCQLMAEHGAALVQPNEQLLTHCNTGGLATAGVGTALGVINLAHQQGKNIRLWVDETRPLLQGGRLTAWECQQLGIPYQLICDNMAAMLMARGQVDRIFVGSDRIAANGDFANKVGTYSLAVLAHYHQVPFYVVAPHTTVDLACADGSVIPIEQRNADEVRGVSGAFGQTLWAPEEAPVFNPAFDVTPASLVTGWVLDTGIYSQQDISAGVLQQLFG
ncbi:S-methyl-5-thioribose-1-phosphate isomerase [Alishewanella sp. SMS8]|uniref:S-methyl-5-thioribose-1-phosphate isomerase n=1 Tax=unclassified Alishewanella TaxID=2628974 RepID=UPI002740A979|nr:S-methyl-5-thioribose-1-phosphate isomerase [Alishewanella sp. SMS8]MDP4946354.1 S-methyl-5-thioribose-1-phosphate isomerase [Alishewanella sp.]MDP5206907.1 S-methyl-5-thioribose-1-phosphate isomerase [Alishewanella sp. SMS9]MDP5037012.1 S-methyl-5-thioribose-1-phosphate isomerase [Alishewanella sp.]MDP5186126.1 S-methyl-5-thioribose-1-phosphate isomerase [Alishewanella sp.]MDP5460608.1 S-methyl-5-thioribose-1-phosphate isomerase [Alishewanella sp. SMS8]